MSEVREFVALSLVRAAHRWGFSTEGLSEREVQDILRQRIARSREIVTAADVAVTDSRKVRA